MSLSCGFHYYILQYYIISKAPRRLSYGIIITHTLGIQYIMYTFLTSYLCYMMLNMRQGRPANKPCLFKVHFYSQNLASTSERHTIIVTSLLVLGEGQQKSERFIIKRELSTIKTKIRFGYSRCAIDLVYYRRIRCKN